jgi:hypothetical protein
MKSRLSEDNKIHDITRELLFNSQVVKIHDITRELLFNSQVVKIHDITRELLFSIARLLRYMT